MTGEVAAGDAGVGSGYRGEAWLGAEADGEDTAILLHDVATQ